MFHISLLHLCHSSYLYLIIIIMKKTFTFEGKWGIASDDYTVKSIKHPTLDDITFEVMDFLNVPWLLDREIKFQWFLDDNYDPNLYKEVKPYLYLSNNIVRKDTWDPYVLFHIRREYSTGKPWMRFTNIDTQISYSYPYQDVWESQFSKMTEQDKIMLRKFMKYWGGGSRISRIFRKVKRLLGIH